MPGIVPRKKPTPVALRIGKMESLQSCNVGKSPLIFVSKISCFIYVSRLTKISDTPKRPITACTRPMPSMREGRLKVKRLIPAFWSIPIVPKATPKTAMIIPLIIEPVAMKMRRAKEKIIKEKYSGGPNLRAKLDNMGAKRIRPNIAIVPAMKDPIADMPKAGPARPWRAMM